MTKNEHLKHKSKMNPGGVSTLRGWKPGVLQKLMDSGMSLKEAQEEATKNGDLVFEDKTHNLVTSTGFSLIGSFLLNEGPAGILYHAIGTGSGTPAESDIALFSEFARKEWTLTSMTGDTISFTVFYAAAECTAVLTEAGTFADDASATPGSGTMFSHYLQPKDNHVGSLDLTYDYDITLQNAE